MESKNMKIIRLSLFVLILSVTFLSGCSKKDNTAATKQENVPQLDAIKNICQLATLECRYHNVAKSKKTAGEGLVHLGEKERIFWIEYTGVAEISFDLNELKMKTNGTNIKITLPEPTITTQVDPDSWTPGSYVISDDHWIQKNPITADDQTQAINEAQLAMEENLRNNSSLLTTASQQAKELITNYIDQIGEATGTAYTVSWE